MTDEAPLTPVPSLPVYDTTSFIHPKQQKPLTKMLNRLLMPKHKPVHLPKKMPKKKHQVRFY